MKLPLRSEYFALLCGIVSIVSPLIALNSYLDRFIGYRYQANDSSFSCADASSPEILMFGTSHVSNARYVVERDDIHLLNYHGADIRELDSAISQGCGPMKQPAALVRVINSVELYKRRSDSRSKTPRRDQFSYLNKPSTKHLYNFVVDFRSYTDDNLYYKIKFFLVKYIHPEKTINPVQRFGIHAQLYDFSAVDSEFAESLRLHVLKGACIVVVESPVSKSYSDYLARKKLMTIDSYLMGNGLDTVHVAYIPNARFDRSNPQYYVDADHLNSVGWSKYWSAIRSDVLNAVARCRL
jgi:hypothetical protein